MEIYRSTYFDYVVGSLISWCKNNSVIITSLSHIVISSLAPSQLPIPGSFSRILFTFPPPQLFVHSLQSPHADHSQPNTWPKTYLFDFRSRIEKFKKVKLWQFLYNEVSRHKFTLGTTIAFTLLLQVVDSIP